jgi:hypothetical protein
MLSNIIYRVFACRVDCYYYQLFQYLCRSIATQDANRLGEFIPYNRAGCVSDLTTHIISLCKYSTVSIILRDYACGRTLAN